MHVVCYVDSFFQCINVSCERWRTLNLHWSLWLLGGKFSWEQEHFWKEPTPINLFIYLFIFPFIYVCIYVFIYLLVLKPEKIQSDISSFKGLPCSLLLTKIESDLNFIRQVIKRGEVWPDSTLRCRSGTLNVLHSRDKPEPPSPTSQMQRF